MKKRILPILLALVMLLSLMPTVALAVGESTQQASSVASYTNNSQVTKYYNTVGAAISASNAGGGTVTLLKDAEFKATDMKGSYADKVEVPGYGYVAFIRADLILDLGGHTLTTADYSIAVNPSIHFTVKNGVLENTNELGVAIMTTKDGYDKPGSNVTIESSATIIADEAVLTVGNATVNIYGTLECVSDAICSTGPKNTINLNGANITAGGNALYQENKDGGSVFNVENSNLVSTGSWAVYIGNNEDSSVAANQGMQTLNIKNSKISGVNGIAVFYTNVDIDGEDTEVTAEDEFAFAVAHNMGENEGAVGNVSIKNGTFNGKLEILEPYGNAENEAVLTVSGGKFDTDVDGEFIAANLKYGAFDGQYFSYHETREAALAAAGPNGSVFAITGPGRVTHTVTIDYDNGTEDDTWTVIDNETIAAPAVPTKSGYTFICWDDGAVHYLPNDDVPITKDTTLTAKWIGNDEYSLSLAPASLNLLDVGSDTITVSAEVPEGYELVMTNSNGSVADAVMSEDGKTITVTAKNAGSTTISVSIVSEDGVVTLETKTCNVVVGPSYAITIVYGNGTGNETVYIAQGDDYRLPAAPSKPGYIFMGWKCSDGHTHDANEVVTVTGDMTFTAIWANMPDITPGPPGGDDEPVVPDFPFTDVREGQWFYEAVKYVYSEGIMNGMDRYTFQPNDSLTRAMVWTMLARMDGVDTEGGATWYSKAQDWAMSLDISDGTNPMGEITRQELVTMLWRYAYVCDADMTLGDDTNILSYIDIDKVSDWAVEAFQWCCGAGIIEGDENGALNPTAGCTRAEAAAMFMRLCKNVDLSPTV